MWWCYCATVIGNVAVERADCVPGEAKEDGTSGREQQPHEKATTANQTH